MSLVTLHTLVQFGLVNDGDEVSMIYASQRYKAVISKEGLAYNGALFDTPSGWALHVIRQSNPNRRAVDGWRCVQYKGKVLSAYMHVAKEIMMKRYGNIEDVTPTRQAQAKHTGTPSKRARNDDEELAGSTSTQSYVTPSSSTEGQQAGEGAHNNDVVDVQHLQQRPMETQHANRCEVRKPTHRRKGRPQSAM